MKRTIAIILLGLVATASAFAQAAKPEMKSSASMPTADQILDKYVKAVGGKAAIEKHTSRVLKGTIEIPAMGAGGTVESYNKAPNKSLTVITIAGFGVIREGFDGTTGWAEDPTGGMREKSGIELDQTKLDAVFHKEIRLKELYPQMEVKGQEKVGERMAYVIEATPAGGSMEKWYFDADSGLLVRVDIERENPQGKVPVEVYLDDYREVDGVKLPFSLRQVTPAFSVNLTAEEIKHGAPIDDMKFKKPNGQ